MTSQFPNVAHFRTIENAKLFVHEEQPAAVATWLLEFLTGGAITFRIAGGPRVP
jgi:pimeloyl-ACP methyl ester carboxylesterase